MIIKYIGDAAKYVSYLEEMFDREMENISTVKSDDVNMDKIMSKYANWIEITSSIIYAAQEYLNEWSTSFEVSISKEENQKNKSEDKIIILSESQHDRESRAMSADLTITSVAMLPLESPETVTAIREISSKSIDTYICIIVEIIHKFKDKDIPKSATHESEIYEIVQEILTQLSATEGIKLAITNGSRANPEKKVHDKDKISTFNINVNVSNTNKSTKQDINDVINKMSLSFSVNKPETMLICQYYHC